MTMGRPTIYKAEYCELLIKHMGEGLSFESFAAEINTCRDTLYNWKKEYPDFFDAHKAGLDKNLAFWEKIGRSQAIKGKGNTVAWIFNMKNRHKWKDNHEVIGDEHSPINIVIKERKSDD